MWISTTGAPIARAASICAGSAAINSDTRMPAAANWPTAAAQRLALAGGIETAFGGALGPPFRNDAGGVRPKLAGDADHFRRRRHFEIERLCDALLEADDIVVENMTAVLAQMRGDAVGAGGDGDLGRLDRIGMTAAARIAHGGDMVDVDAEADGRSGHVGRSPLCRANAYPFTRSALATTFFARNCEMIEVRCLRL